MTTTEITVVQGCNRRVCDCIACLRNVRDVDRVNTPNLPVRVYHGANRWRNASKYKRQFGALAVMTRLLT